MQRSRNAEGLCAKCRMRKLPANDLCYRHLFLRKLAKVGIRATGMAPVDKIKREQMIARFALRYNSIRLGHMRPAGGVDEKMLRQDVLRVFKELGILGARIDKKPALIWGGARGYRKVLDIVRRFDRRAYKEHMGFYEPKAG